MANRLCLLSITIICLILLSGCEMMESESPSDVVVAVYMAANSGNSAEVEKYLSAPDPIEVEVVGILASDGKQQSWKPRVQKGSIQRIEILKEDFSRSYRATVHFNIHFKDGNKKEMQVPLIKEAGSWKIER